MMKYAAGGGLISCSSLHGYKQMAPTEPNILNIPFNYSYSSIGATCL